MTLNETTQILFMLSAYYGQGKANPKLMAVAWHAILKDYQFGVAQEGVIEFAKNDKREYASFPTPGVIVDAIDNRVSARNGVINARLKDTPYEQLEDRYQAIVTKGKYEQISKEQIEQSRSEVLINLLPRAQKELVLGD